MTLFSLCDYSGNWSAPYKAAGATVYRFDPKLETDESAGLYGWTVAELIDRLGKDVPGRCDGLLMAPPCTDFSNACNRLWAEKDIDGRTAASLGIVDGCLWLVDELRPSFWALENPRGRLWALRPQLGKPFYFQPYHYGDPHTKLTGIAGRFVPPLPLFIGGNWEVKPDGIPFDARYKGTGEGRRSERSMTPRGFARAFFLANSCGLVEGGAQ
jgi:hypothetical protein